VRETIVVLGAGPAGLAVGAVLREQGLDPLLVDRADSVGSTWRHHYDRLHLHTARSFSHLPGLRMPRSYGRFVARADVVAYLDRYAEHHRLRLALKQEVQRVERTEDGWRVVTADGEIETTYVVVATGPSHSPLLPAWPGLDGFTGDLVTAAGYQNPTPYTGRDVLVVGGGNTASEIAVDLVEGGASRVRVAVRTPPNIVRREIAGVPSQVVSMLLRRLPPAFVDRLIRGVQRFTVPDLSAHGLARPVEGVYTRIVRDGQIPILDIGFIDAVRRGQIEVVPAVVGFAGADVLLAGGARVNPDAVIVAVGYQRDLKPLVGHLGVLSEDDRPLVSGANTAVGAPDLYFIGFVNPISGNLRELGIDARRIAKAVQARSRRTSPARMT
jgi:putative flavoprotein involved in K+ transport